MRLKEKYKNEVLPKLKEEFGLRNALAAPKLSKIVINVGAGEAKDNQAVLERILAHLAVLTGQKPVVTKARGAISNFKISKGQGIGAMVTLRGGRMYNFLDKLISIVLPRVRDFRGIPVTSFDQQGNYTLGLKEQTIFPEIDYKSIDKIRGLEISVITTTKDRNQSKRLLELLGMPFKKN